MKKTLVATRTTKLAFAILPRDDFSDEAVLKGDYRITVQGEPYSPTRHREGYLLFLDLPEGIYKVGVETDYYFPREVDIDSSEKELDKRTPEVVLKPNPDYPFPYGATVLKGIVVDKDTGLPVSGAELSVDDRDEETESADDGRFVLYFKDLEDDTTEIKLEVEKDGFKKLKKKLDLQRGETQEETLELKPD